MASFPNRCQHLKINGTQCGSPALRRNRFCFFHKRFEDERIHLHAERVRRGAASFVLPVLEDANSIQVALMQVMRLLVSKQIEHKTASLLLYALQTASTNLRSTNFNPLRHDVILDPRDAADALLGENLWEDDDFEEEELSDEEEAELAREQQAEAQERRRKDEAATNRWVEELEKHYSEEGLRKQLRDAVQQARYQPEQNAAQERNNREFEQREADRRAREQAARATATNGQIQKQPANSTPATAPLQKAPEQKPQPQKEQPAPGIAEQQVEKQNLEKKPEASTPSGGLPIWSNKTRRQPNRKVPARKRSAPRRIRHRQESHLGAIATIVERQREVGPQPSPSPAVIAQQPSLSREAATECSPRRKPWDKWKDEQAPKGRKKRYLRGYYRLGNAYLQRSPLSRAFQTWPSSNAIDSHCTSLWKLRLFRESSRHFTTVIFG